jgi:hypothetical protein
MFSWLPADTYLGVRVHENVTLLVFDTTWVASGVAHDFLDLQDGDVAGAARRHSWGSPTGWAVLTCRCMDPSPLWSYSYHR